MSLPTFEEDGNLPPGIHQATLDEIIARFGNSNRQRQNVSDTLRHIYRLASATGHLQRFIIFGSYVTKKPAPHDIDIVLVMDAQFSLEKWRTKQKHYSTINEPTSGLARASSGFAPLCFCLKHWTSFLPTGKQRVRGRDAVLWRS
jgi:predicted nucleotidyltransferase